MRTRGALEGSDRHQGIDHLSKFFSIKLFSNLGCDFFPTDSGSPILSLHTNRAVVIFALNKQTRQEAETQMKRVVLFILVSMLWVTWPMAASSATSLLSFSTLAPRLP